MTREELVSLIDEARVEKGPLRIRVPEDKEWIKETYSKYRGKFIAAATVNPKNIPFSLLSGPLMM